MKISLSGGDYTNKMLNMLNSNSGDDPLLNDINLFIEEVMSDNTGIPIQQAEIHRIWQAHIKQCEEEGKYAGIIAPFGHGKSIQVPVGYVLYRLIKDPNLRIRIVSAADNIAQERVSLVRQYIQNENGIIRRKYPHIKRSKFDSWMKSKIFLERSGMSTDPSLDAVSVLSASMGSRCDLTVFDDIIDLRNAIQMPTLRKKVREAFENQWLSRIEPSGMAVYIGTVWYIDDLTMELIRETLMLPKHQRRWSWLIMGISEDLMGIECRYTDDLT